MILDLATEAGLCPASGIVSSCGLVSRGRQSNQYSDDDVIVTEEWDVCVVA